MKKGGFTALKAGLTLLALALLSASCNQPASNAPSEQEAGPAQKQAALDVYVPPGKYDEFYAFLSGGFNGQINVVGLPSGRLLQIIPVFGVNPEDGYGFSEETKALLMTSYGFVPWDDAHHPELSQTNGVPDGRWLFINGNNTPRVARIDLREFRTVETLEIPHVDGLHPAPFITENSEYIVAGTRFSVPIPQKDMPIADYKGNFKGTLNFIKPDPKTGSMSIAFQILMPGFDYDVAHCGKGPSHGWCFFSSYNTEEAHTLLEVNASQFDKDFIAAVNWKRAEQCLAQGKGQKIPAQYFHNFVDPVTHVAKSEELSSTTVLTPQACESMVYYLPTPKSPHGVDVDPSGEYIVPGGKLSSTIAVHSFAKMTKAIENKDFEAPQPDHPSYGIPVLKFDSIVAGEVQNACLGPLHSEFDGKGYVYTSCFISSEIIKWKLGTWQIVDRIPVYYSIGHLMIPGGDSAKPWGKYVVALNKITKDRYLPTGPELAQSAQLIDISGEKMRLLLDFPNIGEPHYGQAIPASLLMPKSLKYYDLTQNKNPYAITSEKDARVERRGNEVHVYMTAIRSHFVPDNIEGVHLGDTVYLHVTNLEQDWDIPHGFAVAGAGNSDLLVMPGETLTLKWVPRKVGVFPFYCTDFCSALHQEMQGYVRVSPPGENVALVWHGGGK
jgi:nitrous-oxide reductase